MKKHRYLFLFVIPLLIPLIVGGTTKWKEARRHQQYLEQRQRTLAKELLLAVRKGDVNKVKQLCAQGADLNSAYPSPYGITPLTLAVHEKNTQLAKYLIAQGADVNSLVGGGTPLFLAVAQRDIPMVKLLLASGADVNVADGSSRTILDVIVIFEMADRVNSRVSPRQKADSLAIERLVRAAAANRQ